MGVLESEKLHVYEEDYCQLFHCEIHPDVILSLNTRGPPTQHISKTQGTTEKEHNSDIRMTARGLPWREPPAQIGK